MKRIQMPSSYAVVTEEEKELLGGPSKAATDIENYRNDMHALHEDMKAQRL